MQAPHSPAPHPKRVPGILRYSRTIHKSGVPPGASTATSLPFTLNATVIVASMAIACCVGYERKSASQHFLPLLNTVHSALPSSMRLVDSNAALLLPPIRVSPAPHQGTSASERCDHLAP